MPEVDSAWLDELSGWLRIPSVSADATHRDDVARSGEWICDFVRAAGGTAELQWHGERPLALGEVPASTGPDSPTVLVYGHFDVQPPAPLDLWESPPFEPTVRDGHLYARGATDDKGNLYLVLKAAATLAAEGALPVNVRIACDGEEEVGGHSIVDFIEADERGAQACLVYDGGFVKQGQPGFYLATRGLVYFHVRVRTGVGDLHSGMYGGAAMNAIHVLTRAFTAVLPRDGRVPEPLRAGITPPTEEELAGWRQLPTGEEEMSNDGARPADERALEEFYIRTFAEPSLDVNGIEGGSPQLIKTVLPVEAHANVSIRLAPGQEVHEIAQAFERLLREATPENAELELTLQSSAPPAVVDPESPPLQLALDAFEGAVGRRPLLVRVGGTLPVAAALAQKGIPTVLTGFGLPGANVHAPNERFSLAQIPLGVAAARATLTAWGSL